MVRKPKQLGTGESTGEKALTPVEVQQMQMQGFLDLTREILLNPAIDPDKLEKLMNLQERVMDRTAKQLYDSAMHLAQQEMSFVVSDKRNPDKGNKYASYKAIDKAIRPIYSKHGFSVSFDTGPGKPEYGPVPEGHIRVLMDIAHAGGWQVQKHTDIPVETTGAQGTKMMTKTHATGSGMSYGKRYLVIFGFNLAVGEQDDDGNAAGKKGEKPAGGADHRFKEPTGKSAKKNGADKQDRPAGEGNPEMMEKYPAIKRANNDGDRVQQSSLNTLRSNMKRMKVSETDFADDFGFPMEQVDKHALNELLEWIKERS